MCILRDGGVETCGPRHPAPSDGLIKRQSWKVRRVGLSRGVPKEVSVSVALWRPPPSVDAPVRNSSEMAPERVLVATSWTAARADKEQHVFRHAAPCRDALKRRETLCWRSMQQLARGSLPPHGRNAWAICQLGARRASERRMVLGPAAAVLRARRRATHGVLRCCGRRTCRCTPGAGLAHGWPDVG